MNNDKSLFFAGVHWGRGFHQVCVIDRNSSVLGEKTFKHGGRELCEMARWLTELCGASPEVIAVGIEVPRGPVVESLLEGGFCVHSVTPRQLDRFRDRFCASGAKDDRRDAQVLASALRTDRSSFRHVEPQNPDIITLRELNRTREELVGKRTRLVNRLRELLWRYYPQFNELMGAAVRPWHLELWALAPEFAVANRVRVSTVRKLLRRHRIRRLGAEGVLEMLRSEEMNIGETTVTSCVWRVRMIIKRMKVLDALLKETEVSIREMIKTIDSKQALRDGEPTDVEILRSIPGVGDVVLATLLSEAWGPICRRDRDAASMSWRNGSGDKAVGGDQICSAAAVGMRKTLRRSSCHGRRGSYLGSGEQGKIQVASRQGSWLLQVRAHCGRSSFTRRLRLAGKKRAVRQGFQEASR